MLLVFLVPPWEPVDEDGHVRNVETLVAGHYYRIPAKPGIGIETRAGTEPQQPPLYYLVVAGWQKLLGIAHWNPHPQTATHVGFVPAPVAGKAFFVHRGAADVADGRRVPFLRILGVIFGAIAVIFTAMAARRLSRDPWTPVVAAATFAFVPRLVFLSAGVNNDNLVVLLGALGTALSVIAVTSDLTPRRRVLMTGILGIVGGALVLAKLTGAPLLVGLAGAVAVSARSRHEAVVHIALLGGIAALVCGWWFARNDLLYGDVLASGAARHYLGSFVAPPPRLVYQALVGIPRGIWKSFWYTSGWNQFTWPWWAYLPFWAVAGAGIAGLARSVRQERLAVGVRRGLAVLSAFALAGLGTVWVLGLDTPQHQARVGFGGLAAIACLIALGLEWLRVPLLRAALPVLGLCGTIVALLTNVIAIYR